MSFCVSFGQGDPTRAGIEGGARPGRSGRQRISTSPAILGQCLAERFEQWRQMAFIIAPTPDRSVIKRLPHLPPTGRRDRPLGAVKVEAGRLPLEAEESNQTAALALEIGDQRFVFDL